jgi:uncharacterized protein
MMRKTAILLFSLLLLFPAGIGLALDVPKLTGYVNDNADIISSGVELKIENYLRQFEGSDSTQIGVLTIPSLEGESLEEYALKVAEAWLLGQKGKDNGVLLLVARDDRKIRIEVGYGLEGKLTDLLAGRIIDQEMVPYFRQGNFEGGIIAGINALTEVVRGEYKGDGRPAAKKKRRSPWGLLALLFFLGPSLLRFGALGYRGRGYRRSGMFWIGGPFGGGGGGGFGGGGFSGGGGGFGGGGASGGW